MINLISLLKFIKFPLLSDKNSTLKKKNYSFIISNKISKLELKLIFNLLFNNKLNKLNTSIFLKKKKNKKLNKYFIKAYKKVFIFLN